MMFLNSSNSCLNLACSYGSAPLMFYIYLYITICRVNLSKRWVLDTPVSFGSHLIFGASRPCLLVIFRTGRCLPRIYGRTCSPSKRPTETSCHLLQSACLSTLLLVAQTPKNHSISFINCPSTQTPWSNTTALIPFYLYKIRADSYLSKITRIASFKLFSP